MAVARKGKIWYNLHRKVRKVMKSRIAEEIMRDYKKKKQYEENKRFSKIQEYKRDVCVLCRNKDTDLCSISENTQGKMQCVYKDI